MGKSCYSRILADVGRAAGWTVTMLSARGWEVPLMEINSHISIDKIISSTWNVLLCGFPLSQR